MLIELIVAGFDYLYGLHDMQCYFMFLRIVQHLHSDQLHTLIPGVLLRERGEREGGDERKSVGGERGRRRERQIDRERDRYIYKRE